MWQFQEICALSTPGASIVWRDSSRIQLTGFLNKSKYSLLEEIRVTQFCSSRNTIMHILSVMCWYWGAWTLQLLSPWALPALWFPLALTWWCKSCVNGFAEDRRTWY